MTRFVTLAGIVAFWGCLDAPVSETRTASLSTADCEANDAFCTVDGWCWHLAGDPQGVVEQNLGACGLDLGADPTPFIDPVALEAYLVDLGWPDAQTETVAAAGMIGVTLVAIAAIVWWMSVSDATKRQLAAQVTDLVERAREFVRSQGQSERFDDLSADAGTTIQTIRDGLPIDAQPIFDRTVDQARQKARATPLTGERERAGQCTANPQECCQSDDPQNPRYLDRYAERIRKVSGVYKVLTTNWRRFECCLEWDRQSGHFEIFLPGGRHNGARECNDLAGDPCAYTQGAGAHNLPDGSGRHAPRLGCQTF